LKQEEGMDIFFIHPFTVKPLPDDISSKKHQVFCAIRANGPLADRIWEGFQLNQPTNQPTPLGNHQPPSWLVQLFHVGFQLSLGISGSQAMPSFGAMLQAYNQCLADAFALVSKLLGRRRFSCVGHDVFFWQLRTDGT